MFYALRRTTDWREKLQTWYILPLSNEERLAPVPEAPAFIYMVKTKEVVRIADNVRKYII